MPTRVEFEAAAEKFLAASRQLAGVTAAVEHVDVGEILRGGSLGHMVPAQIVASSATAGTCQRLIEDAAEECSFRAVIIAEYEVQLAAYDVAYQAYEQRLLHWRSRYNRWWRSPFQWVHPGARPLAPPKPFAPPAWAEVRRV